MKNNDFAAEYEKYEELRKTYDFAEKAGDKKIAEALRTEVRTLLEDAQAPPVGTSGTVYAVDDATNICVNWDDGSGLNVVYGEDIAKKIFN